MNINNIKILDCTLRDGGYVNSWEFGQKVIFAIYENLSESKIDYIECGFLKDCSFSLDKTLYNRIEDINKVFKHKRNSELIAMVIFGQFSKDKIIQKNNDILLDSIRVTFKKHEINEAFEFLYEIKKKGYKVFANPTNIDSYSDIELLNLIEKLNELRPYGFSIVDTKGILKEQDLLRLYLITEHNLSKEVALCFHSHNNLQLSFSNAQCLMKLCKNRELIIDSTIFGMGRGAGNLCTELLTQYINDNYNKDYDIIPILKIIDEQINPVFAKTPWGYSVPYYLAATNHCHPNYAKYLVDKQTVPVEIINHLLQAIPNEKKSSYDSNLIKQIYLDNFSNTVDDTKTLNYLKELLLNKKILILAPGKSLTKEKDKINVFIQEEKPFIISLNFIPKEYNEDLIFVTNVKRFESLENYTMPLIVSSNIEKISNQAKVINYSSYLNNSKMFDNVALMFLKLLIKIGIKSVTVAGLDGFSTIATENYVENDLINNAKVCEFDERNEIMSKELDKIRKKISINYITNSVYIQKKIQHVNK